MTQEKMLDTCSNSSEHQFFDALEEVSVGSDSSLDCVDEGDSISNSTQFDVWIKNLESVETRRSKFYNWLGLDVNETSGDNSEDSYDFDRGLDEIRIQDEVSLKTGFEYELSSSSTSSIRCLSIGDLSSSENSTPKAHFTDDQKKVSSSVVRKPSLSPQKGVKKWGISRLRSFNCVSDNVNESCIYDTSSKGRIQRIKVHHSGKRSKELSALYDGQTILAHKGAILTMKFSPDGQFLASAGEDRVVRVWKIMEVERLNERDVPDSEPSSVYFTMNQFSELKPLNSDKGKNGRLRKSPDSACVVLPQNVFRLLEKPVHEFQGHTSEILDLSWSNSNCLLSSSVDKTVQMWRVGHNHCLKVFPHNNYVTFIEFNPADENYFISGSIDGKVRVWEISNCKVVYWTEIKDIVTAVCYRPDGLGGIIGSITGNCRFFSISDCQIQLDAQVSLHTKKKSSGKRITGFQFLPQDPTKVMVSCADSQVRILQGVHVIGKYKGARTTGTFSAAQFTSDGKHIHSAFEDSNVHLWKCINHDSLQSKLLKKVNSSERFISNASIALPWPGLQHKTQGNKQQKPVFKILTRHNKTCSPVPVSFGQDVFREAFFPKGSALWPEEKLAPRKISSMHKSEYKFLKTCQSRSESHSWGLVIVTAGWDGRIRSFHNYGLPVPN